LPVGAMIGKEALGNVFGPGSHGTTFGGNPLAMAAADAVLEIIFQKEFLQDVVQKAAYLLKQLQTQVGHNPMVKEIRGKGLMIGVVCSEDVSPIIPKMIGRAHV